MNNPRYTCSPSPAPCQPGEALCETQAGFLPSSYCSSCATWTTSSSGCGGMELCQRRPRWSSSRHPRFIVYFASTAWTGIPKHHMYSSGESLCVSRKTGWFQTIRLSTGVTTSIARWQLRALTSSVFLQPYHKQPHGWSGLVTTQQCSLATRLLASECVKWHLQGGEDDGRVDAVASAGCREWPAAWPAAPSPAQPRFTIHLTGSSIT